MDFDHVSGVKSFNISSAIERRVGLEELTAEIAKCVLRCRNCHIKKHDKWSGEHYYTSKYAIENILSETERIVTKAHIREMARQWDEPNAK